METVLLLDDDPAFRSSLESILAEQGFTLEGAGTWEDGIAASRRFRFDLLVAGLGPTTPVGAAGFAEWREMAPDTPVILIVPAGDAAALTGAAKRDAQVLPRVPDCAAELVRMAHAALGRAAAARERELLRHEERARFNDHTLVARDLKMLEVLDKAGKLAEGEHPVLIRGEWGTGKELLARWLHFASPRAERAFVKIDSGVPSACSFDSPGRIEAAHGGTLYFDEVGDLEVSLQLRLLTLMREGVYQRPGDPRRIAVDVRVIASSSYDLAQLVANGRFRENLLALLPDGILLPALRDRRSDILPLARFFLNRAAHELHRPEPQMVQAAEVALQLYDWPGNLRELSNVMTRAALIAGERVEAADLPIGAQGFRPRPLQWKEIERQAIEEALHMNNGNRTRAARQLGISLRTLQYRLKEWNVASQSVVS